MTNNVVVSVIMLSYNQEKYIEDALKSVLFQKTNYSFEIIVADDCSTDATPEIIRKYASQYPSKIVVLERKKNLGLIANFMDAYSQANGKYIAICEGDDFWCCPFKLKRQISYLEKHADCAVTFHRAVIYYERTGIKTLSNPKTRGNYTIDDFKESNYIVNVSAVYRNKPFGELPDWFREVSSYDLPLHLLNLTSGYAHFLHQPMAVYRNHGKNIWAENDRYKQLRLSLFTRLPLLNDCRWSEDLRKAFCKTSEDFFVKLHAVAEQSGNPSYIEDVSQIKEKYFQHLQLPERLNSSESVQPVKHSLLSRAVRSVSRLIPIQMFKSYYFYK
ncbi:MAG: glycosyltransferase [Bacteroidales bacterium]